MFQDIIDFGCTDFETIWHRQRSMLDERLKGKILDTLLLGEHPPVITCGRGTLLNGIDPAYIQPEAYTQNIPIHYVERGGDVTYHGPGQLMLYPIIQLPLDQHDLKAYLRSLEAWIVEILVKGFGLEATVNPPKTGVWVKSQVSNNLKKIASIGTSVKQAKDEDGMMQWITWHGVALNISVDLNTFNLVQPCGLKPDVMTSLAVELNQPVTLEDVKPLIQQYPFKLKTVLDEQPSNIINVTSL